jgi:hypothetical protein
MFLMTRTQSPRSNVEFFARADLFDRHERGALHFVIIGRQSGDGEREAVFRLTNADGAKGARFVVVGKGVEAFDIRLEIGVGEVRRGERQFRFDADADIDVARFNVGREFLRVGVQRVQRFFRRDLGQNARGGVD